MSNRDKIFSSLSDPSCAEAEEVAKRRKKRQAGPMTRVRVAGDFIVLLGFRFVMEFSNFFFFHKKFQ